MFEEEVDERDTNVTCQRRSKNSILLDLINNVQMEKIIKKKPSQLTSSKAVQQRADLALAYLVRLCGFKNVTKIAKKEDIMAELFLLLSEVKTRAISAFRLSPESLNVVDYVPSEDNNTSESNNYMTSVSNQSRQHLETFFQEHLANKKYNSAQKLLCNASDGDIKMRSSYLIYKMPCEHVKGY